MLLTILLQDKKGRYVAHFVKDFADIACLSDASQRFGRSVVTRRQTIFGFHHITNEDAAIFRQKEVITCE